MWEDDQNIKYVLRSEIFGHILYDVNPPIKDPVLASIANTHSLSFTVEERFKFGRKIRVLSVFQLCSLAEPSLCFCNSVPAALVTTMSRCSSRCVTLSLGLPVVLNLRPIVRHASV